VAAQIRHKIIAGEHRPGDRLPSEPDLALHFGVSRATLRSAITLLEEDGHLRSEHGSGTYVTARPMLRNDLSVNFGVSEMVRRAGLEPSVIEEETKLMDAPAEVAVALELEVGAPVSMLRRVRAAGGHPVVVSIDWCRPELLTPAELADVARGSLYAALADRGTVVHHGVATIIPEMAGLEIAASLSVARGALLLSIWQVDYTDTGRSILVSREYHLADAFEFMVYRRGPGDPADAR
jgi:DNA-binding GntR family transcriptional regulator